MTDVWTDLSAPQHAYLNAFICTQTSMYYEETELWDIIGVVPYTVESLFPFNCRAMRWANNRIRVQYYSGVGQPFKGVHWKSDEVGDGFNKISNTEVAGVNKTETFFLKRVSFYKNGLRFDHSKAFDGLFAMFIVFSTELY